MTDSARAATGRSACPHVVVIGGGFAGASAVQQLGSLPVRVTLIDRNVYKTFQPLLYQVASAGLNPGDVTMFLRGLRLKHRNMDFLQGALACIDAQAKRISLEDGRQLDYDYLVLAAGATTNYFGTPGAREYAMPMYTRSQAMAIRERIFNELEGAAQDPSRDHVRISVVGGGPTGVEIAGALADFQQQELAILYPELGNGSIDISLVQRNSSLLKEFRSTLQRYSARELRKRQVNLRLGHGVTEVTEDSVVLDDDTCLPSDITIWAAGVSVDEAVDHWGVPRTRNGRIQTDEHLRVVGLDGVFAAGDIAGMPEALPMLAQPAKQTGEHVAAVIAHEVTGAELSDFRYKNLGTMATIGRHAAIAEIPGMPSFKGSIGWVAWIAVHVRALIGQRNRRAVVMNLVSLYFGTHKRRQPNPIVGEVHATPPRD